jgi:NADH-quinone oxidoreductase subunit F
LAAASPTGRSLKAVVPGGSSTPGAAAEEIDIGMDFDQVGKAGSMLGSGGVVVLDDTVCMVEFALRTMKFYQHESCGWCIPCREGTDWLKKTLTRFHAGGGVAKGHRQHSLPGAEHAGPDLLPAGRRGGHAHHRLR